MTWIMPLYVLRSRETSPAEVENYLSEAGLSNHEKIRFLALPDAEKDRVLLEWEAQLLDGQINSSQAARKIEVVTEEVYERLPLRCRKDRIIRFID